MKFPILSDEKGDIMLFNSIDEMRGYLEPIDVKNGAYMFWDADGFRVEGIVKMCEEKRPWGIKRLSWISIVDQSKASIEFRRKNPCEKDVEGMKTRLVKFIKMHARSPLGHSLDELMQQAIMLK